MTRECALEILKAPGAQVPCPHRVVDLLDAAGAFTPADVPIHPRADLAPAIIAWNAHAATKEQSRELRAAGYVVAGPCVTEAGRAAGLK